MQHYWSEIELAARLNLVMTCSQIGDETSRMFLPNNTFVFKARDNKIHDEVLEPLADWLNWILDEDLGSIGKIVVCTSQSQAGIEYAWAQTGYMGMDSGFVVSHRIDKRVGEMSRTKHGLPEWNYESWGKEHGHQCTKKHFEIVYPSAEAKKKMQEELIKDRVEEMGHVYKE